MRYAIVALAIALLLRAGGTRTLAAGPCGTASSAPVTYQHVLWIWMENHSYSQVIGNAAAPYTTQLAQQCGTATNYASVGSPSLPNYIGATAGSTFGITDDNAPSSHVLTANNLFRQVRAAGLTEKSYEESMGANCVLTYSGSYDVNHNPAAYFTGGSDRTACLADDVPLGTTSAGNFINDLTNNTLPNFAFITPNRCDDTHDCSVNTGDLWLQTWLPLVLNSQAYRSGDTAIIIVWDEYTPMPNVFITPATAPGTISKVAFNHYSLLRTTEDMLGITSYLGGAATASSMRSVFEAQATPTASVGGVARAPAVTRLPSSPLASRGTSHSGALWYILTASVMAVVGVASVVGWRLRRRRRPPDAPGGH